MMAARLSLQKFSSRFYSAKAAAKPSSEARVPLKRQDIQVSKLPNGALVVSQETYSPVSRIAVGFTAGTRYEPVEYPGISHYLRHCASLATKSTSAYGLCRNLEQIGANMTVSTSREHFIYRVDVRRDDADLAAQLLALASTAPAYHPWELREAAARAKYERALFKADPQRRLFELLHKAAFRNTLGRSLYANNHTIDSFSGHTLHNFTGQRFTTSNMAIVGLGVDHAQLVKWADRFKVAAGTPGAAPKAAFSSDQQRKDIDNGLVHVAIVSEGPGYTSKDLLVAGVLNKALGGAPSIKWSNGQAASRLGQAAASQTSNPFYVAPLTVHYTDIGLFGFYACAHYKDVGKVLKAVTQELGKVTKSGITDAELKRAKAQCRSGMQMWGEDSNSVLENFVNEGLGHGKVSNLDKLDAAFDAITASDVNALAKKLLTAKPCMAAVGDLSHTPYLEQLL